MACKYCGLASNEVLKVDAHGHEYHQSCEDEFEYSFAEWDMSVHGLPWDGSDVGVDAPRGDYGTATKAGK